MRSQLYLVIILALYQTIQETSAEKSDEQLREWSVSHLFQRGQRATTIQACPAPSMTASLSVGQKSGPLLLADTHLLEVLARFNRERIPERSVHAKGSGAYGYLLVEHDITKYTKAELFSRVLKKTPLVVRFSTVTGELGSSDQVQDARGFAIKFKTREGNYDLVGINFQNFPIRDPILFPSLIRTRKRNPRTHLTDHNMRWDFDSLRPETTFNNLFRQSDLGRPDGYRHMDGFGVHAFKLVNSDGDIVFCKFHYKTNQGVKNLTVERMAEINSEDLDYGTADLYNAIEKGDFPSWALSMQVMTEEEAKAYQWNPFDATKVWLEKDFPLIPIGRIVLDRNPTDFFTEVEEVGFDPGNFVPGIEASPDKLLHGRIFAYQDAQRQRLGANRDLLPVNKPRKSVIVRNYFRDGAGVGDPNDNGDGGPNYFPNSFDGVEINPKGKQSISNLNADAERFDTGEEDNFSQATYYWKNIFTDGEKRAIATNIASTLKLTYKNIQKRALGNFKQVSQDLADMIKDALVE